jgi:hypothetical protein
MEELLSTAAGLPDVFSEKIRTKITRLLNKKPANDSLSMIDTYINGTITVLPDIITSNMTSTFKYCPVMLNGHFLHLNFILDYKRHSSTMDHLEQH